MRAFFCKKLIFYFTKNYLTTRGVSGEGERERGGRGKRLLFCVYIYLSVFFQDYVLRYWECENTSMGSEIAGLHGNDFC
jgi:hypothetical protein